MPLPKNASVGTVMRKLKKEGGRPRKQMLAIALNQSKGGVSKKHMAMRARALK